MTNSTKSVDMVLSNVIFFYDIIYQILSHVKGMEAIFCVEKSFFCKKSKRKKTKKIFHDFQGEVSIRDLTII